MTVSRRELRLRAQEEAARLAAEEAGAETSVTPVPPAEPPLTRRQLREMRMLQETGDVPVVTDSGLPGAQPATAEPVGMEPATVEEPAPEPVSESITPPVVEPIERPIRRRRPVLPPQQTGNTPVIDPETGTIGAITINIPAVPEPEPAPEPVPEPVPEPELEPEAEVAPPPPPAEPDVIAPDPALVEEPALDVAEPGDVAEPAVPVSAINLPQAELSKRSDLTFDEILSDEAVPEAAPTRTSIFGRTLESEPESEEEPESSMTVEQAAIHTKESALVTALRYLVLVIAMFVIGGLIWLMVDQASDSASALVDAVTVLGRART
ncbi:hypothetical protein SAMN06298212_10543 [Ruaniaceae bacterium KH17]|nr:hypothetical protein SAMN06298212_10543 [Ruaniaceae bacterium KH17]